MPLHLSHVDRAGQRIPCGNGFRVSHEVANRQDLLSQDQRKFGGPLFQETDYSAECDALVALRRSVAVPVAAIGVVVLAGALITSIIPLRPGQPARHASHTATATRARRKRLAMSRTSPGWVPSGSVTTSAPLARSRS
jgi:hypothetical protein